MKNTLRLNHAERTIVMDKTFAKFAANTMSPEYAHLQQVRQDYPLYTMVQRHIKKNTKQERYAQRVFSMYGGKQQLVTIRFINLLLDTAVERFGTKDAIYAKVDDRHFSVTAQVEISDLFYGWLLGFGKRVKLTYPDDAVEGFRAYLEKVYSIYKSNS